MCVQQPGFNDGLVASASLLEFQLLFLSFGILNGSANVYKGSTKHLLIPFLPYLHYELIQSELTQ